MIGILIVSHGSFSQSLLESAELIAGKQQNIKTLSLNFGDNISNLVLQIKNEINKLSKKSSGVLVLTDLLGGSPSNATAANMENLNFKCITGVNHKMLHEAII